MSFTPVRLNVAPPRENSFTSRAGRRRLPQRSDSVAKDEKITPGLRQDELAGASGVGLRFIVDLEAGKPTAQIGKTLQVLAALGCSLDITPPPEPKGARKP